MKVKHTDINDKILIEILIKEIIDLLSEIKQYSLADKELMEGLEWIENGMVVKWLHQRRKKAEVFATSLNMN